MANIYTLAYEHEAVANEFLSQYSSQNTEVRTLADIVRFNSEHADISLPKGMPDHFIDQD